MTGRLRTECSVLHWPRSLVLAAPGELPESFEGANLEHLQEWLWGDIDTLPGDVEAKLERFSLSFEDPTVARSIRDDRLALDRMYGALGPHHYQELISGHEAFYDAWAGRQHWFALSGPRPTLPSSVLQRQRLIESLEPRTVWFHGDADGLSILLAQKRKVGVYEPNPVRRRWLLELASAFDFEDRLTVSERPPQTPVDLVVTTAGNPTRTRENMRSALSWLGGQGHAVVQLAAPWDTGFMDTVLWGGRAGSHGTLRVTNHLREVDVPVVPGGFALDGAGDLVVLEISGPCHWGDPVPQSTVEHAQPYYWLDFDALPPDRLQMGCSHALVDMISTLGASAEANRSSFKEEARELVTYHDAKGLGLTAQLHRSERHLLVTLMPFDEALAFSVETAVFHTLGDRLTRMRPNLTVKWKEETIFG